MRRSKRSACFSILKFVMLKFVMLKPVMLKSFAGVSLYRFIGLIVAACAVALVSSCSDNSSGLSNTDNSIVVVGPDNPLDDSPSSVNQNSDDTTTLINPTGSDLSSDTSGNTSSLQEVNDTDQMAQSAGDNSLPPLTENMNTAESVSPNVIGGLPADCIFDISASNVTFCYQASTRTLRAWQSDGSQWWAYILPGDSATNDIHALQVVNENLYTVTELKSSGVQTGFEISVFAPGGAFIKTVALDKFEDYSFVAGHRIQVADIEDNLIIAGDYGLSSNNILPNQFNGTFIAIFNTTTEQVENSKLYPQLRQTNPMQVSGDNMKLELEHLVYELSPDNLELMEPISRFQSISFSRTNYHQKKHSVIGLIEKPPFETLHTQMSTAFLDTVREIILVDTVTSTDTPVDCAGGGTVQQIIEVDDFDSEVQTITFENCSMADLTAHGVLLQRQTHSCGQDCEGLNRTLRALAFEVTYADGGHWFVDGYVSTKETRNFVNENNVPIDNPETVYANQTEINVFSMSDNQISINLEQGQYQYNGTLKNGTSTWAGSGIINYATGETETFAVDLSRQLFNGIQSDFSGQMDASRSDGTALFVDMDTVDQSGVRYTTTAAGESVQTTSAW